MPIHAQCPSCGRKFQAPDKLSGRRVKCPKCSAVIQLEGDRPQTARQAPSGQQRRQTSGPAEQPGQKAAQWYVKTADDRQLGPMPKSRLDALVAEGRLDGFCHLRREDRQQWQWAEAVYPQFALPTDAEVKGEAQSTPAEVDVPTVVPQSESRLRPCPDCAKMVSKQASRCPSCGCPLAVADDQTDQPPSAVAASRETSPAKRNKTGLLVAAAVSAVLLICVLATVAGFAIKSMLSAPADRPQEPIAAEPAEAETATPEEMQQCMEEAAAAAAKQVDDSHRKVHAVNTLLGQADQSMDLIRALAEGNLDAIPEAEPAAETEDRSYQSQYQPLYEECLAYLRTNVPAAEFDRSKVRDLADRWAEAKLQPLQKELEKQFPTQLEF